MNFFTEKERAMFTALGLGDLLDDEYFHNNPVALYRIAVEKCFVSNKQGKAVVSLRSCMLGLYNNVYRHTDEWDSFIQLD